MTVRPVSPEVAKELAASPLPAEAIACMAALSSGEITAAEGFRTENGGGTWTGSLDTLPDWGIAASTAIGAWQDVRATWTDVVAANPGITFNPQDQIRGNWWLAKRDYAVHTGGGDLLAALKAGELDQVSTALLATWPGGAKPPDFQDTYRALLGAPHQPPTPVPAPQPAAPTPQIRLLHIGDSRLVWLDGWDESGQLEDLPPAGGVLSVDDEAVCSAALGAGGQWVRVLGAAAGTTVVHYDMGALRADLEVTVPALVKIAFDPDRKPDPQPPTAPSG
jgi:hypothetical protein